MLYKQHTKVKFGGYVAICRNRLTVQERDKVADGIETPGPHPQTFSILVFITMRVYKLVDITFCPSWLSGALVGVGGPDFIGYKGATHADTLTALHDLGMMLHNEGHSKDPNDMSFTMRNVLGWLRLGLLKVHELTSN